MSIRVYVTGFVLSLLLTLASFFVVTQHVLTVPLATLVVLVFAVVQFAVQLGCFFHLRKDQGAREKLLVLSFAVVVVLILVSGSVWIMYHLNHRMMSDPSQMNKYMQSQQGI